MVKHTGNLLTRQNQQFDGYPSKEQRRVEYQPRIRPVGGLRLSIHQRSPWISRIANLQLLCNTRPP